MTEYRAIEGWLIDKMALLSDTEAAQIDVERAFVDYALDSSLAVTLAEELSKLVGRPLPVTLFWEYPSICALAMALSGSEAS